MPSVLIIEVSSFQGSKIEGFHCICTFVVGSSVRDWVKVSGFSTVRVGEGFWAFQCESG